MLRTDDIDVQTFANISGAVFSNVRRSPQINGRIANTGTNALNNFDHTQIIDIVRRYQLKANVLVVLKILYTLRQYTL